MSERPAGAANLARANVGLFVVALAALFVRLPGLSIDPLWLDEANTVLIASRGFSAILDALGRDGNPPLFYFLLHVWMGVFGNSEAAVRALTLLFGIASLVAVHAAARSLFPARGGVALAAAALVAIGPLHVYYSQEARMYTLTPLLGVLALKTLHDALETGRARHFAAHAALLTAGLYTHNYFLFVAPVLPLAALVAPGRLGRRRAFFAAAAASLAAALLYTPWVPVLLRQSASGVGAWIPAFWHETPPAAALLRSFEVMGVGGAYPGYLLEIGTLGNVVRAPFLWLAARVAGAILAVLLLFLGVAASLRTRGERPALLRLAAFALLPLAIPYAASFVITPIYLVGRYEMVAFMGFVLLAARGLRALFERTRAGAAAAAAAWLSLSGLSLGAMFAHEPPAYERGIAQWIRDVAKSEDAIVFPGYTRTVPEYYLERWGVPGERLSFPGEIASHLGWFDFAAAVRDEDATRGEAHTLARSLAPVLARGGRVILVGDWTNFGDALRVSDWLRSALVSEFGAPIPVGAAPGLRPTFEVFRRQ
jgi:4-amino-4-deoxy-L-arabinose transferase-like glycosyltransferase